jgi:Zn-dependent M28 family amino/carboxypeptidase
MKRHLSSLLGAVAFTAATAFGDSANPPKDAIEAIDSADLLKNIKALSSDEFEGRAPGSQGEEKSVEYIAKKFEELGLKHGNPNGTYTQEVPLAGITTAPEASFIVGSQTTALKFPDDYVASSARLTDAINLDDSQIVFVGYGIVAPEYGWDDYKDVDVKGKTILMLINDPPLPDPKDPTQLDANMFKGRAMTYYGRWTYKYEIATQKGAAAAVIIHETEPAAYPYSVVRTSWSKENFEIDAPNKNMDQVGVRSWVTLDVAKKLLADSGQDFDALKKSAMSKDFRPVSLDARASFHLKQTVRSFKSHNVVGRIDGSDPKLKDEWIIYSAHWDHLGKNPDLPGDQIFNGAVDNASGVAAILELAEAHRKLKEPTKRSVLFLATTAEEAGLLGAKYYAQNPLYPLKKTLADINIDSMNVWGRSRDLEDLSFGFTNMDDMLADALKMQGRTIAPPARPEKGSIYRADNFEFSKVGLPSLYIGKNVHLNSRPADGPLRSDEFDLKDYHQVTDQVNADWDLAGAVEDIRALFAVGYRVANGEKYPEWKAGSEFKAKRDEMMKK